MNTRKFFTYTTVLSFMGPEYKNVEVSAVGYLENNVLSFSVGDYRRAELVFGEKLNFSNDGNYGASLLDYVDVHHMQFLAQEILSSVAYGTLELK